MVGVSKMYVERIGVRVYMRLSGSRWAKYEPVTCSLMSERGLFAGVAIGPSLPPDKGRVD